MSVDDAAAVVLSLFVYRVKDFLVLAGCGLLAKDNLDAAGERLQKALEQLQIAVDGLLKKAEHGLSGSARELTALRGERERVGEALTEMKQKYADLQAVTEVVSSRLEINGPVRASSRASLLQNHSGQRLLRAPTDLFPFTATLFCPSLS